MPISWLHERPHIHLPGLWMQPGTRHWTPWCGLWASHSADRQAPVLFFCNSPQDTLQFAIAIVWETKHQYTCWGKGGSRQLQSLPNASTSFLQDTRFKIPESFHLEAMSLNLSTVQKVSSCSPPQDDGLSTTGTELEITELIETTEVGGPLLTKQPWTKARWLCARFVSVWVWKFSTEKEILWTRMFRFKGNLRLERLLSGYNHMLLLQRTTSTSFGWLTTGL